ncbi:MAG TPA: sulfurtransferase [Fontimonas sp.]
MSVLNIAAYRFVSLQNLEALREQLLAVTQAQQLKGTILLAEEGINLFLAGSAAGIEAFIATLDADERFAQLIYKRSLSAKQPFRKMLVKIKREIIRMDQPQVQPAQTPAPEVTPRQLKAWLDRGHDDAGREVVLLDTRNAFEVEHGSFDGAIHPDIAKFSEYPDRVPPPASFAGKTVVTFCTGGIRCEKAAPWMLQAGYENVLQLKGGILQYFEDCGGAHFHGDCFVFDERRALDDELKPSQEDAA